MSVREVLERGSLADFEFIVGVLDSNVNFADDLGMQRALRAYRRNPSEENRRALTGLLEREYRYAGSSDLAYFARWATRREPGVAAQEIVSDVAGKLGVKLRMLGSFEAKLERLVKTVVEREITSMSEEEQQDLLLAHGAGQDVAKQVKKRLKRHGPAAVLPLLLTIVGAEASERIVTSMVVRQISWVLGREAARELVARLGARFPWWADWVGPLAWSVSGTLLTLDIQGPAYRKTIPVTLYLGLIGLRRHAKAPAR